MYDERRFFHIVVNVAGGRSSSTGVVFQALSCGCSLQTVKKTIPLYACTV